MDDYVHWKEMQRIDDSIKEAIRLYDIDKANAEFKRNYNYIFFKLWITVPVLVLITVPLAYYCQEHRVHWTIDTAKNWLIGASCIGAFFLFTDLLHRSGIQF